MNQEDSLLMALSALNKGFISNNDFGDFLKDPNAANVAGLTQILVRNGIANKEELDEILHKLASDRDKARSSVFGKFVLIEKIGRGGGGEVYHAIDLPLRRSVALKILNTSDPQEIERFRREAQYVAKLHHPNIVQVYEVGEVESRNYISMQFVDGVNLEKVPLPLKDALQAVYQVAMAVDYANRNGVIHRDVKPSNILFDRKGEVFLTDFGCAKKIGLDPGQSKTLSINGMVIGTPAYMSPEQARGDLNTVDARTDVYLLGSTLYYLVTRHQPFRGETVVQTIDMVISQDPIEPRKLVPHLSREVELIILKAMEKEKGRRYASARDLARDVRRYLRGEPLEARGKNVVQLFIRLWKRSRIAVGLTFLAILELMLAAFLLVHSIRLGLARAAFEEERKQSEHNSVLREWDALVSMADALLEHGQTASAIQAYGRAIELQPRLAKAYHKRGLAYFKQDDWKAAYQDLKHAADLLPELRSSVESYIVACQKKITER